MTRFLLLLALALPAGGQTLEGVVDIHAHANPDSVPRSIDFLNLARLARQKGYKAIVLKSHYESTASWAAIARQEVPGLQVFGGIALNRAVGGVNPAAVERMTRVQGGYGRIVWMPTFDSENQARVNQSKQPFVSVSRDGKLLPEVLEVLSLIAKHKLTLATGHSSPSEVLMLIREAKRRGVTSIVVTHPVLKSVALPVAQMKEAASLGAMLEFVGNAVVGNQTESDFPKYAEMMRQAGWDSVILSSDFGQQGNPLHPDGLEQVFRGLRAQGVTEAQINQIVKTNPSKLLGLR